MNRYSNDTPPITGAAGSPLLFTDSLPGFARLHL